MIGEGPSLIEILPPRLKEALDRALQAGEKPVLAVRGNPQEALAATASRLLTLREGAGSPGAAAVEAYPLAELTSLELRESSAGTVLTWSMRGQPEPVVFAVPSYDAGKFRQAADLLRRLLPGSTGASTGIAAAAASAAPCPKCGTALPGDAAFCPICGLQSRDVCWDCGRLLETEWRFCPSCGGEAAELGVIPCPRCRAPVGRDHAYCPQCGTAARPVCGECDRVLRRSWRHCPACGAPASGDVTPSAAGLAAETAEPVVRSGTRVSPSTPFPEPGDVQLSGRSDEAEALNQRGIEAYEKERFREAVDLFRQALARDPDNATFHCNLAVACGEMGLDQEAFAEYQRTLALNPSNVTALVNLGYLYSEQERYEEARDCWERAVGAAPDSPEAAEARENLQSLEQL